MIGLHNGQIESKSGLKALKKEKIYDLSYNNVVTSVLCAIVITLLPHKRFRYGTRY